ncbi:hypothetical protein [Nonomuraea sp. NPDC049480]|uniref:hypothetical protein n=1 Tax=Nonomuraea sp. NPDC049480 TaxID=3364353 RepID=UPI0037B3AA91
MTRQWQPPDQQPDGAPRTPPDPHGQQDAIEQPAIPAGLGPPSPVLGIISLLMGLIGAVAAFVPMLRLPGILIGLVAATLAVVTVAANGLGGKMFAAGGLTAGLAALPIGLALFLQSPQQQRAEDQAPSPAASSGSPSSLVSPSGPPAQGSATVVFELIGENGVTSAGYQFQVGNISALQEVSLPFTHEVTIDNPLPTLTVFGTTHSKGADRERGRLICRVKVNGKVVDEQTGHGQFATCMARKDENGPM